MDKTEIIFLKVSFLYANIFETNTVSGKSELSLQMHCLHNLKEEENKGSKGEKRQKPKSKDYIRIEKIKMVHQHILNQSKVICIKNDNLSFNDLCLEFELLNHTYTGRKKYGRGTLTSSDIKVNDIQVVEFKGKDGKPVGKLYVKVKPLNPELQTAYTNDPDKITAKVDLDSKYCGSSCRYSETFTNTSSDVRNRLLRCNSKYCVNHITLCKYYM